MINPYVFGAGGGASYFSDTWKFEQNLQSESGNHNGTATGTADYVAGAFSGYSARFGSGMDYVTVSDDDNFTFNDGVDDLPFTIAFGFNSSNTGGTKYVMSKADNASFEWRINTYQGKIAMRISSNQSNNSLLITDTVALSASTWYHIVFTYDGSGLETGLNLYIDGSIASYSTSTSGTYTGMVNNTYDVVFGALGGNFGNNFLGQLDEIKIYKDKELTSQEVTDLFNSY